MDTDTVDEPADDRLMPRAWQIWQIGAFVFDPSARTLSVDGTSERISGKASKVLVRLAEQAGQVVSRDQLIAEVWDGNVHTGSRALTHTMSLLRRSLRPATGSTDAPATDGDVDGAIETISKSGYRLLWPASRVSMATSPATLPTPSPGAEEPALRPSPRRRLAMGIGVAALLLVLAALAWWRYQAGVGAGDARRGLSTLTTLEGAEEYPSYSPDGHFLSYVWTRAGAAPVLRVVDLREPGSAVREFADPLGLIHRPVWVDNQRLAYLQAAHAESCRVMLVELRDGNRRDLAECHYLRGAAPLAASPDGQWLAFTRRSAAAPSDMTLVLHHIGDGQERELAHALQGLGYGDMAWSHDGRHLAVLQLTDTVGDILKMDIGTGEVLRLTREAAPIWALTWSLDDRELIFSAGLEGDFAVWRIPAEGGASSRFARIDNIRNLVTIPDGSGDIAASVVRYDDRIERYSLADGALREAIRSSGRDLYADACRDAEHPIFVSFRARRIGLWYRDGAEAVARELPLPSGTPEPPSCSPDGSRYATVLSPPDGSANRIVIGSLDGTTPATVIAVQGTVSSPTWSADGQALILASNRGGRHELWRFDPETRRFTALTIDGGRFGREVVMDGEHWLYYARIDVRGLWRVRLDASGRAIAGETQAVVGDLELQDLGNWSWYRGQLWRILRHPDADQLVRRDASGRDQVVLSLAAGSVGPFRALSIRDDGQALLGRHGQMQADIVRIPDAP